MQKLTLLLKGKIDRGQDIDNTGKSRKKEGQADFKGLGKGANNWYF